VKLKQGSLSSRTREEADPLIREGIGVRTFFEQVCEHIGKEQRKSYTISELASDWEMAE
jgi:hypothetical protein